MENENKKSNKYSFENIFKFVQVVFFQLIIVSGALFYGIQIGKSGNDFSTLIGYVTGNSKSNPNVLSLSSTAPANNANQWKNFNNESFSFYYPGNWDIHAFGTGPESAIMVAPVAEIQKVKDLNGGFSGGSFLTLTVNKQKEVPVWQTDAFWKVTDEPTTLAGSNAVKFTMEILQDGPGFSKGDTITSVVTKKGDYYIKFDLLDKKQKEVYDKILSTVVFK